MSPRINQSKRITILFFTILLIFGLIQCKQTPKEKVQIILSDKTLSQEDKIRQAASGLFSERLKEIEIIPEPANPSNRYEIYIAFGGTSALTFLESAQYANRMKLEMALASYQFLQSLEGIPFGKFRMSLVKPFFIKNGAERGIEEFEIFRFRTDAGKIRTLPGFKEVDSFATDRNEEPITQVMDILKQITDTWEIELDHFSRIEVK